MKFLSKKLGLYYLMTNRWLFITCIVSTMIISSCNKEQDLVTLKKDKTEKSHSHSHDNKEFTLTAEQIAEQIKDERKLVLGKKLENPYTLENMAKAQTRIPNIDRNNDIVEIKTTDLYVRFLPKNAEEFNLLREDTTLELFSYPLDYEIKEAGDYYQDPTLPIDSSPWYYTAVSKDYAFKDVKYEIIEELFLIESAQKLYPNVSDDYWLTLEDKALSLTNNLENHGARASKWNPSGRIKVQEFYDNINKRDIAVNNVKVRAVRWFTIKTDYTNSAGYYSIGSFRRSVNYSVIFETNYAKVTNWIGYQTFHYGPKRKSSWNTTFNFTSNSWVRATLINAMGIYRSRGFALGIQNPYPISYWAGGAAVNRLNVRAVFGQGTGLHIGVAWFNDIKIWSQFSLSGNDKQTDWLYRVMFHELGHRSHTKLSYTNYVLASTLLTESWGEYIEWKMMLNVFPPPLNRFDVPALRRINPQFRDSNNTDFLAGYTPLFIDLVDDENQRTNNGGDIAFPDDNIIGYQHSQIQNALANSTDLEDVRDYLVNSYNNRTENEMNTYFNFMIPFE